MKRWLCSALFVAAAFATLSSKVDARDRYGERVLDHMTEATGGRAFDAHAQSAKSIFASIAADLRSM